MLTGLKSNNVAPQLSEKRIAKITENYGYNRISVTFAVSLRRDFCCSAELPISAVVGAEMV
jgi:hypothetical protein